MTSGERPPLPPKHPVELLAPAGDPESLRAAVENGADAVYLGGEAFNARKFAANFSDEELQQALDFAHVRGVRIFVTLNTLIKNHEFYEAVTFLEKIRRMGADGVIVQDLGIMRAVHEVVPDLPLHISTQATVHNSQGIRFLEDLGAERVILARENTLDEMAEMGQRTGAELEQFVHGAMCYCYSGQCLMSSLIGGRSGNRGACAYTCRLPYTMEEGSVDELDLDALARQGEVTTAEGTPARDRPNVTFLEETVPPPWEGRQQAPTGAPLPENPTPGFLGGSPDYEAMPEAAAKHIISARDMNTLEHVDRLIDAGVVSFKIEGRMKRPEYVATVTRAYRNAIDRAFQGNFHIRAEEKEAVRRIFNRAFNKSWLDGKEKWSFTNWDTAGNQGVPLGRVEASGEDWVRVRLEDTLRVKDGIVIVHEPTTVHERELGDEPGQRPREAEVAPEDYGFTVTQMLQDERYIKEAGPGEVVKLIGRQKSRPGDPVYKTADIEVLEAARETYQHGPTRTVPIRLHAKVRIGQPLVVRALDPRRRVSVTHEAGYEVQPARNAPLTQENVVDQLDRLGKTPFRAEEVSVDLDRGAFVPLGELNAARRAAVDELEAAIAAAYRRDPLPGATDRRTALLDHTPVARDPEREMTLAVNCWGLPNLKAALQGGAKTVYFGGLKVGGLQPKWDTKALARAVALAEEHDAQLFLAGGMVQKDHEIAMLEQAVVDHLDGIAGILAGNHGALKVAMEAGLPAVTDWPLNVYNSMTVDHLHDRVADLGGSIRRVTLSPELTLEDVESISAHTAGKLEVLAHGRLQLMTSDYCSIGHATDCQLPGGTWAPCHDHKYQLRDRKDVAFPLETDGACRMYILNSVELNMVDRLDELHQAGVDTVRIETIGTEPHATKAQVETYLEALAAFHAGDGFDRGLFHRLEAVCEDGFTTGHFYRGPL